MEGLRQKLENQGLRDVAYMVVNRQGEQPRNLHAMLAERMSEHITLYKQDEQQADVWQTLNGGKDDFLIYDRSVTGGRQFIYIFMLLFFFLLCSQGFSIHLWTGVAVLPTTFHFRTLSSDLVMWRVQSKIPIANVSAVNVQMR